MFARGFDHAQPDGWATNKNRIIDDHDWLKGIRKSWENNINGFLKTRGLPLVSRDIGGAGHHRPRPATASGADRREHGAEGKTG